MTELGNGVDKHQEPDIYDDIPPGDWSEESLRKLVSKLSPFNPPPEFTLGDEFATLPPRPIPSVTLTGTYHRRWRLITIIFSLAAVACLILDVTGIASYVSFFVLALGYIRYITITLFAYVGLRLLLRKMSPGPFRYVTHGLAGIGRVLAVGREVINPGDQAEQFKFVVGVEYRSPERSDTTFAAFRSERIPDKGNSKKYSIPLSKGDYIPIVGFPGKFESTAQLYGFLGLNPKHEYILKNGMPTISNSTTVSMSILFILLMLILAVPLYLYVAESYAVTDGPDTPWIAGTIIGAILFAIIATILHFRVTKPLRNWKQIGGTLFAGFFFGALCGFFTTNFINGVFDRSPPRYLEIEVVEYWEETLYPIFIRKYEIEFHRIPSGMNQKHLALPENMWGLSVTSTGLAEYGQGALGMEWLRAFHPTSLVPLDPEDGEELIVMSVSSEEKSGVATFTGYKAVVILPDGTIHEPSRHMRNKIKQYLASD